MDISYLTVSDEQSVWTPYLKIYTNSTQIAYVQDNGSVHNLASILTCSIAYFVGEGGASYTTKGTESQPSEVSRIIIPQNQSSNVFGRYFSGSNVEIGLINHAGDVPVPLVKRLYTGKIGEIQIGDNELTLELVGKWERLKSPNPWVVSENCVRGFGKLGCPGNRQSFNLTKNTSAVDPTYNASTGFFNFSTNVSTSPTIVGSVVGGGFVFNSSSQYAVSFDGGQSSTPIQISTSTASSISFTMSAYPVAVPETFTIFKYCDRSYGQCVKYGFANYFAGSPFLTGTTLSYIR